MNQFPPDITVKHNNYNELEVMTPEDDHDGEIVAVYELKRTGRLVVERKIVDLKEDEK